MSFTPCPSPSKKPSYSAKTQEEINHQALRENLQQYYITANQQKLRQKQKELEKKKVERTTSASSTTSSQGAGTGSNKKVTTIGNVQLFQIVVHFVRQVAFHNLLAFISSFYPKIHVLKISLFTKFTSPKIHNLKVSFFTKFTI